MSVETVTAGAVLAALSRRKDEGYNVLVDFTAADFSAYAVKTDPAVADIVGAPAQPAPRPRFEAVYLLAALDPITGMEVKPRVELRCQLSEGEALPSAAALWPAADWLEREVWDMFGIRFSDRPGIKRLLMYEEFSGHPLRKDYPIHKRQPLIGPASGEAKDNPSFNAVFPTITGE